MFAVRSRVRPKKSSVGGSTIEAVITNVEFMTAKEYLRAMEERPHDIESSVFCPPGPGSKSFGSFQVKFQKSKLVPSL